LVNPSLIDITPLAAEKLENVLREQGEVGSLLRVVVVPSGHGGLQYMLGVEQEPKDGDVVIETERVRVLVDSESSPLIEGAQIDYVDGLMRSGFVISNPNVENHGGCGCGGGGGGGCGGGGGGCGCGGGGGGGCGAEGGGGGGACGCGAEGGGGGGACGCGAEGGGGGGACGCGAEGGGGGCGNH
jgi:iron-sulfur cluster assembly accessory protein